MKITNNIKEALTFGYGDDAHTIMPGETSPDLKLKADDPFVTAHFNAGNITVTGRNAPKADDAPAEEQASS